MMDRPWDRREFLRNAALAGSTLALPANDASGTEPAADPAPWFDRPMRWAQLTLVENDPGRYDLHFWLDYFARTHSDAACLSAGGCVAYYPTRIPLHYRSQWMGDTDPFGDLVAGSIPLASLPGSASAEPARAALRRNCRRSHG